MRRAAVRFIFQHVFLPPELPQCDDDEQGADDLLKEILRAARDFARSVQPDDQAFVWRNLSHSLPKWIDIYDAGTPCSDQITKSLQDMSKDDVLLFYVKSQNAAIVVRNRSNGAIFECFEVLPTTDAVLGTKHALLRKFPARAVFIPERTLNDPSFTQELGNAIHTLSVEQLKLAMEESTKAGHVVAEARQSAHPRAVTEWLFGVLASRGTATPTSVICKRTHDDVCFEHSMLPWRRSGVWLCARVTLQIALHNAELPGNQHSHYKNFMLFLLSRLATQIGAVETAPDVLHVLRVKLARRNAKLASSTFTFVQGVVEEALRVIDENIKHQWKQVIDRDNNNIPSVPVTDATDQLVLHRSGHILHQVWYRAHQSFTHSFSASTPRACARVELPKDQLPSSNLFNNFGNTLYGLVTFEHWVKENLNTWLQITSASDASCCTLLGLMQTYHSYAKSTYAGHPVRMSITFLTILELWVALDKLATTLHPLLLRYSPEVPSDLLVPILLSKRGELERLSRIENYITSRHSQCNNDYPSIFCDPSANCLAAQFYGQSHRAQTLRQEIETRARTEKAAKEQEWRSKKAEYEKIMEEVNSAPHGVFTFRWGRKAGRTTHDKYCSRCAKEKTAKAMTIDKYEWPLPEGEIDKQAAIFELLTPESVVAWRDATWLVVQDIGRIPVQGPPSKQDLLEYRPLKAHAMNTARRITIASPIKPTHKSHYFRQGLDMDEIFVKNGLRLKMYDSRNSQIWTADQSAVPSLHRHCETKLPPPASSHMNEFVNDTRHTQNSVLARQSKSPPEIGPHEHFLLGSLRSGEKLQSINILTTLKSTEINLNSLTTALIFLYATSQVGKTTSPVHHYLRESQIDFKNWSFCLSLLDALEFRFARIEANWKEATAANVLLVVNLKLLSLADHPEVVNRSIALVLRIRQSGLEWIRQVAELLSTEKDVEIEAALLKDISKQIVKCCLLTRRTFDVDVHLQPSMCCSPTAIADYVEASIHLHNHSEQASASADAYLKSDLLDDRYRAALFEKLLGEQVQHQDAAFSEGIKRFWPAASFTSKWISYQPDPSWIENKESSRTVHFNLISGSLLVSGRPQGRLPAPYKSSPLYRSIFGNLDLDVYLSDVDDMEYKSRVLFENHQIYLGMREGTLIIRSRIGDHKYEAILRDTFLGDLPTPILQNTIPWMSLNDGRVFFRPKSRPWISLECDWVLTPDLNSRNTAAMRNDNSFLIGRNNVVGKAICEIIQPFEHPHHVLISMNRNSNIEAKLPRYHLSFFVTNSGEIQCKEFSAMIDRNQAIGTLHGLKSRLVLQSKTSNQRIVLIPNGDVTISKASSHVSAEVHLGNNDLLKFSQFQIDARLGQLVSSDLESHLYKAYLHAITSFPEPDSLTGRSGGEETVLCLLDSISRTSLPLSDRAQTLLRRIGDLSPKRSFYPEHLKVMHSDTFHASLPILSQRDIFYQLVEEIITHNSRGNMLFNSGVRATSYQGDLFLLDRSHHRSRKLYATDSVVTARDDFRDHHYSSRDHDVNDKQRVSSSLAGLVAAWPSAFSVDQTLKRTVQRWQVVRGFKEDFIVTSFSQLLSNDIDKHFARLFNYCRSSSVCKEHLAFTLSLMAFGNAKIVPQLRTLLAFAISPSLRSLPAPKHNLYDLRDGSAVDLQVVRNVLVECEILFTPRRNYDKTEDEQEAEIQAQMQQFDRDMEAEQRQILDAVSSSWPGETIRLPPEENIRHYSYTKMKSSLNEKFNVWHKNHIFLCQLDAMDEILRHFHHTFSGPSVCDTLIESNITIPLPVPRTQHSLLDIITNISVNKEDFGGRQPSCLDQDLAAISGESGLQDQSSQSNDLRAAREELETLVEDFAIQDRSETAHDYAQSLRDSIEALKSETSTLEVSMTIPDSLTLDEKATEAKDYISYILTRARELLQPQQAHDRPLVTARIWPQVNELTLLRLLSAKHRALVPTCWVEVILSLANEITALQRVERIQRYLAAEDNFALQRELANPAHAAWSTSKWPDWLLLEVQNNMLIRPVQVRVAEEIMKNDNGLVLLGMGEGKTSVILPMVIMALANSSRLVRVVVLKPLASEMLRLLSRSLAGLCGRIVYHLPFSRSTKLTSATPQLLMSLYKDCVKQKGVLLTLPEHLNSFRLIGYDKVQDDRHLATELTRVQMWLDDNARDILDESDEILKPSYELVYTNGEANLLAGAPDRWNISLEILDLIQQNAPNLHEKFTDDFELEVREQGSFSHIRILNDEGAKALTTCLIQEIIRGKLPSLPIGYCNNEILEAVDTFLHCENLDASKFQTISEHFNGSAQVDVLYVVRGLISHNILTHGLRKRWLVNYGLDVQDPPRCLSAVPYRAKSVPSPSAEFAQPETMVLLTALSWLYTGLRLGDLRKCIQLLLRSADPSEDYSKWVENSSLPDRYRSTNSINLEDTNCVDQLYIHLKNNKELIFFFLRSFVYPREAKEFRFKLSTSAWDLCARTGNKTTSGFSGTCDSRIPVTCFQKDLDDLRHSTAKTLTTLLRPDNRKYICAASPSGQRLSTEELLKLVVRDQRPDVIIDVGAQILENNQDVASKWLEMCPQKMGAIFFSENDEKMVLNREGTFQPFISSAFKDEIGSCLIYLDEFHTRGTDFQLPDHFQAAVLLGPGILKDGLVQACMRMRKLSFSQSVRWFAPPEVDARIRAFVKHPFEAIDSSHVLRWAIDQSCRALRSQRLIWTLKGLSHSRRRLAFTRHVSAAGQIMDSGAYMDTIRERESRPVSEMYRADDSHQKELPFEPLNDERDDAIFSDLLVEWDRAEVTEIKESGITEEQEREVLHEIEQEREVQRPAGVQPATPQITNGLLHLIRHGILPVNATGFRPAYEIFMNTRLASQFIPAEWPQSVLVTEDYLRTIQTSRYSPQDDFLRPAQWIIKGNGIEQLAVISPHEANELMPKIRDSKSVTLIVYMARIARDMASFDAMDVYKVPESDQVVDISRAAIVTLNLLAGQLYFSTFQDYRLFCGLLGLWDGERLLPQQRAVASDNFVSPACREANGWTGCKFTESPVGMLKAFISMRRLGTEWSHTHMGRVLAGRILRRDEFQADEEVEERMLSACTQGRKS